MEHIDTESVSIRHGARGKNVDSMEHVEPPVEWVAGRGPLLRQPDATPGAIRYASPMKLCLAALLLPATLFAQPKSLLIEDMTWTEVRDAIAAGKTTAIYYAASIEENLAPEKARQSA